MSFNGIERELKVVNVAPGIFRILNWDTFTPADRNKNKIDYVFVSNGNVFATWENIKKLSTFNRTFSSSCRDIILVDKEEERENSQKYVNQVYLTTVEQNLFLYKMCEKIVEEHGFDFFTVDNDYDYRTVFSFVKKTPAVYSDNPFLMKIPDNENSVEVEVRLSRGFIRTLDKCVFYSKEEKELYLSDIVDKVLVSKVHEILEKKEKDK